ncbi:MAG: FAD-dependent monooxygenase [Acidimicrobiia bacterium]|nr:FAD-dependent monooxygenase [Acidimicrobiia bacterium]
MVSEEHWIVAGAGLTGCLAAVRLARRGIEIDLVEKRPDLRVADDDHGRSINLALSTRGLDALARVGLDERIRQDGIPMRGRMMHAIDGALTFQAYGPRPEHAILSVSRDGLNIALLDAVAAEANITARYEHAVVAVDIDTAIVTVEDADGRQYDIDADAVLGADGAYSRVRSHLQRSPRFSYEHDYLEHGYKELTIPPAPEGTHRIDPHALHIWPRGSHMMIALPNPDGSFTCTLFWPFDGEVGFDSVRDGDAAITTFERQFPDALDLMPDLADEYVTNPTSTLVTIRCRPWYHLDKVLLVGDASHAVVPFYGQGANAALEDVTILCDELDRHEGDRATAFASFYDARKPDADALADLAIDNFVEMRDRVTSRWFLARKRLKNLLAATMPSRFEPLYTMVTFSRRPYAEAVAKAGRQDRVLTVVGAIVLAVVALIVALAVVVGA